ncbi:MAG: hypothetical protein KC766_17035, partial [Myxococcales bacterium]|nr:hypothetical protein [Myxococcales bacterium]
MSDSFARLRQKLAWEEATERWYVPRDENFLEEIIAELGAGRRSGVLWVTGPSGGGLSTQLARLSEELTNRGWRPLRVSLLGRAEPGRSVGPTGMLMLTLFWLMRALPEGSHRLTPAADRTAHRLIEALRALCMVPAPRGQTDWTNSLGHALYLAIQRLKDPGFREEIETDSNLPIADFAELVGCVAKLQESQGEVVMIVDDANELDQGNNADRLMPRCASLWQSLPVRVVMTHPRRLEYSEDFAFAAAGDPRIVLRPLPHEGRVEFHQRVLERRLPAVQLESAWVELADESTHGNTAEFLDLVARALCLAQARGEQPTREHLVVAGRRRGGELRRLLAGAGALRELLRRDRAGSLDEVAKRWLGLRALLEVGDDATLRVHPG